LKSVTCTPFHAQCTTLIPPPTFVISIRMLRACSQSQSRALTRRGTAPPRHPRMWWHRGTCGRQGCGECFSQVSRRPVCCCACVLLCMCAAHAAWAQGPRCAKGCRGHLTPSALGATFWLMAHAQGPQCAKGCRGHLTPSGFGATFSLWLMLRGHSAHAPCPDYSRSCMSRSACVMSPEAWGLLSRVVLQQEQQEFMSCSMLARLLRASMHVLAA